MKTQDIAKIVKEAREALGSVSALEEWDKLYTKFLGRKGEIAKISKGMKDLSKAQKKELGQALNKAKTELEQAFADAKKAFKAEGPQIDVTLPGKISPQGSIHPLTLMRLEMMDLFRGMGFDVMEGPELENDFFNFEALNIPPDHPARDIQDTFFVEDPDETLVMRTHTSNTQVRYMQEHEPPYRVIAPGRVFRNEATDATHEHTFYQLEGFVVDEGITAGHLIGILEILFSNFSGQDVKVRLRPNYFPFVEPGFEMDFSCGCKGNHCRVCKGTGWIEMGGCGMIHPNVLKAANVTDPSLTGLAFGMGINRLAMLKYGIDDIRWFQSGDKRFLDQF